jgi:lysine/arginine/ornithine transport system substrate-binding protein
MLTSLPDRFAMKRKDETALQASINDAIASMLKDGTYAQIAHKYFDFDPYGGN